MPLLLLWLSGACLRLTVLAIPPVVPLLHADLHLSETAIGWLSSLPPMLFAIAAVPGALAIARFGLVRALLAGLLLTAAGSALRGAVGEEKSLYVFTIVMSVGIAVMQPALPPLVRAWFPQRIGFATAMYSNGLLVGETLAVALAIPVVLPLVNGSWRMSFVVWSVPVLVTAVLIALYARRGAAVPTDDLAPRKWWPDWKDPLIWRLGLIFGSVNATYFFSNAFLPDYVISAGHAELVGPALTALNFGQLPASVLMLPLAGRLVTEPRAYVTTGLLALVCVVGMMVTNGIGVVIWAGLLGFIGAITMVLALALPSVLSAPDDVHRTSAGMFTVSYSCAMVLSVLGGWLWDVTHQPIAGFAPIALCGLVIAALAPTVKRAPHHSAAV
jgi:CP family cyanate transporter-like MFS transporter